MKRGLLFLWILSACNCGEDNNAVSREVISEPELLQQEVIGEEAVQEMFRNSLFILGSKKQQLRPFWRNSAPRILKREF